MPKPSELIQEGQQLREILSRRRSSGRSWALFKAIHAFSIWTRNNGELLLDEIKLRRSEVNELLNKLAKSQAETLYTLGECHEWKSAALKSHEASNVQAGFIEELQAKIKKLKSQ